MLENRIGPGTPQYPAQKIIVLERQGYAVHGIIPENKIIHKSWRQHDIKRLVLPEQGSKSGKSHIHVTIIPAGTGEKIA
jgi:hypothetical protein